MTNIFHHHSLRKRSRGKSKKQLLLKGKITWFDRTLMLVGILNAVATVPQVLKIWVGQDAAGVSVISWAYYAFGSIMFLIYGIIHKEAPIIVNYSLGIVLYLLIVIGTLMYS